MPPQTLRSVLTSIGSAKQTEAMFRASPSVSGTEIFFKARRISAFNVAIDAEERIARLVVEVESADAELIEKDDEIAALKAKLEKKPNGKNVAGKRAELKLIDEHVE